jgi:hypothetical protein
MGLLEKRNPRATRRSVILWACGGGIGGFVVALMMLLRMDGPPILWFVMLPWMTVASAGIGALMEWQMPC